MDNGLIIERMRSIHVERHPRIRVDTVVDPYTYESDCDSQ